MAVFQTNKSLSQQKLFTSLCLKHLLHSIYTFFNGNILNAPPALKSSPSKKGRVSLTVPKFVGPAAAWSASQLSAERDENIYDLRGARSFPTLEDEGKYIQHRVDAHLRRSC